jgi:adenylosuccinate synthase
VEEFPADTDILSRCRPVYREVGGFDEFLGSARSPEDLPEPARAYLRAVEEEIATPVEMLSVGPERTETVTMQAR